MTHCSGFRVSLPDDPADMQWTQTLFLIFSVPEAGISGNLYNLARPNLGVCHSSIKIHKGLSLHPWQIEHNDAQMHLPCPEHFDDFTLANGLSFQAHSTRVARSSTTRLMATARSTSPTMRFAILSTRTIRRKTR